MLALLVVLLILLLVGGYAVAPWLWIFALLAVILIVLDSTGRTRL